MTPTAASTAGGVTDTGRGPDMPKTRPQRRLRTAADQLDERVRYAGDNPGMALWAAQNAATAVVLRAVAHEWDLFGNPAHGIQTQPTHWDSLAHIAQPALALADVILASGDE